MPSLVVELSNSVYSHFRGIWSQYTLTKTGVLSGNHRVKRGFTNVNVDRQVGGTITVSAADDGNARLIKEIPKQSVFADFDMDHTIVFSVRYSGCAHSVYRLKYGQIVVLHIYRGNQLTDVDGCVKHMRKYADDKGLTELHTLPTRGVQGGACSGIVAVSERYGGYVRSTLVKIGANGSILGTTTSEQPNAPRYAETQL